MQRRSGTRSGLRRIARQGREKSRHSVLMLIRNASFRRCRNEYRRKMIWI